jgi:predicted SnoaL-like aldol condensation-catalyzing enzyme
MKLLGASALMLAIQTHAGNSAESKENNMNPTPKEQVAKLLKSIETGDAAPIVYVNPDKYIQHNLSVGDGLSGFGAALKAMAEQGITMKYTRVHKVLGQGNFVLVISEGEFAGKSTSFYDLFRVHQGKIAEHWDTIETIPVRADWKNPNGKFGFK